MSAPTLSFETAQARRSAVGHLRLWLKLAYGSCGVVQGAWWPRTDKLFTELPLLLAALSSRLGTVNRVIYDENSWAPASLRMEFRGRSIILECSSNQSTNTLSVIGEGFGRLVLLVVPPDTDPTHAYTAVMTAAKPDDVSSPDELLGIATREAQDRRQAAMSHQRWETDGGALRRRGHDAGEHRRVAAGSSGGAACSATTNSKPCARSSVGSGVSPELTRLCDSVEPQPAENHRKRARTRVLIAAAALTGLALLGPHMLNET